MDIKDTLAERQKTHGDFIVHARIAQHLKTICAQAPKALTPVQQEALDMICHKMARILAGNPNHADHWIDIAGYATLVEESLDD